MFLKTTKFNCLIGLTLKNNLPLNQIQFDLTAPKKELHLNVINSFKSFKLSKLQKRNLTLHQRNYLNTFQNINLFELKKHSLSLCEVLNKIEQNEIWIEASELSVWICLAAIHSGKLKTKSRLNFIFSNAPMGLFPKALLKEKAHLQSFISYQSKEDYWPEKFDPFMQNNYIKMNLLKVS